MRKMSKLMSVVMLFTFVSTFVLGDMIQVYASDNNYGEGHYYEEGAENEQYPAIPETWNQATKLNPNMTEGVVNTAKHPIQSAKTAVSATGNALKTGFEGLKTGVANVGAKIAPSIDKFRNAVGEGVYKLGNSIQKDETYVKNESGQIVKVGSRTEIMNELGIIEGKNGRYYMKGRQGSVSAEEVESLIAKKEATLAKTSDTASETKADAGKAATTTALTQAEAMKEIGVVQKGNNKLH